MGCGGGGASSSPSSTYRISIRFVLPTTLADYNPVRNDPLTPELLQVGAPLLHSSTGHFHSSADETDKEEGR